MSQDGLGEDDEILIEYEEVAPDSDGEERLNAAFDILFEAAIQQVQLRICEPPELYTYATDIKVHLGVSLKHDLFDPRRGGEIFSSPSSDGGTLAQEWWIESLQVGEGENGPVAHSRNRGQEILRQTQQLI